MFKKSTHRRMRTLRLRKGLQANHNQCSVFRDNELLPKSEGEKVTEKKPEK